MTLRSPASRKSRSATQLPELRVPLTSSLIVAGALASRDFTPVHHDKAAAQAAGMQDVFMNILTTEGFGRPLRHGLGRRPTRGSASSRSSSARRTCPAT